jgi:hypothetical protein
VCIVKKRRGIMVFFSLFELFLVAFAFYAVVKFEGGGRIVVPTLCLVTVFLFERLQGRLKEDEEVRKRLLRYKLEDHKKKAMKENAGGGIL